VNGTTNTPFPTPHGFKDTPRSRFLRARPPDAALRWVEQVLRGKVRRVQAYRGGSSSAIHGVRVETGAGTETFVLRRYVIDELNAEEPDLAEREALALQVLTTCELETPQLLAVDTTGSEAGHPAVLMTRVPGRLDWSPSDFRPWLRELASLLPVLHETPADPRLGDFAPYPPEDWDPPDWLRDKRLWHRLVELYHRPPLDDDRVFIHRDYHPGNVLFRRAQVTGVVDWQAACLGPRCADVWHCRANLLGRFGRSVADDFLAAWTAVSGQTYNPWAEAVMLVDVLAWSGYRDARERREFEELAAERVAELG
jgi:aminoglycoside phosphotransferase (APT) family kinase protein